MGRYVPRSGWAEQKTSRESCCGETAIHHTCQPEFRRAKNCSFALTVKVPEGHQRELYGRMPIGPIRCLELELEGELDEARAADLVGGIEAVVGAAGPQAARQFLELRPPESRIVALSS